MNLYRKEKIEQTVQTYLNRKHRSEHPEGKFDKQMRWYPSEREKCECCEWIRQPSNAYPYSLLLHCRTMKHVANLYGITEKELKDGLKNELMTRRTGE